MATSYLGSFTIECSATWLQRTTLNDGTSITGSDGGKYSFKTSLAYGTALDQGDTIWTDQRTIAAGANDDLDLTSLARTFQGSAVSSNFARVKCIVINVLNGASGDKLTLDSSATNAYLGPFDGSATSKLSVGAGNTNGPTVLSNLRDGFGLTTTSNKILRVTNPTSGSLTYAIAISGTSA